MNNACPSRASSKRSTSNCRIFLRHRPSRFRSRRMSQAADRSTRRQGRSDPAANVIETPFRSSLTMTQSGSGRIRLCAAFLGHRRDRSLDGNTASNGKVVNIKGKLKAENLKLAKGGSPAKRAVEIDLVLAHDLAKQGGTLERCPIHIGAAQANVNGTYRLNEESPVISVKLAGTEDGAHRARHDPTRARRGAACGIQHRTRDTERRVGFAGTGGPLGDHRLDRPATMRA